jgi:hypothetical protein
MNWHAWFSEEAANMCGSYIYADAEGNEVEVTACTVTRNGDSYGWPDKVYLGTVVRYVKQGREAPEPVDYDSYAS